MVTTSTMQALPMTTPSMVSAARTRLARSASMARCHVSDQRIEEGCHWLVFSVERLSIRLRAASKYQHHDRSLASCQASAPGVRRGGRPYNGARATDRDGWRDFAKHRRRAWHALHGGLDGGELGNFDADLRALAFLAADVHCEIDRRRASRRRSWTLLMPIPPP